MEEFTVTMQFSRETKNTYLYVELDDQGREIDPYDPATKIGSMYVKKTALNRQRSELITVTVKKLA